MYEPLGIVNLEAMACETAVVASDVGGIPEVVVEGETGHLVHYDEADPTGFEESLAASLNAVMSDPAKAAAMGVAGRARAVGQFGWDAIARDHGGRLPAGDRRPRLTRPEERMPEFDPQRGIDFPIIDGRLSSMDTGRAVFADAARATDPELAARIEATANWRKDYMEPARDLVVSGLSDDRRHRDHVQRCPGQPVPAVHVHPRRPVTDVAEAFDTNTEPAFATAEVVGHGRGVTELVIPYHGHHLSGPDLRHQLDVWVADGIVEPSFAHAIESVMAHPEMARPDRRGLRRAGRRCRDGSAGLPARLGCHRVGRRPAPAGALAALITEAENRAGRLRIPVPIDGPDRTQLEGPALAAVAGADLLTQAPEIRTWLAGIGRPFTLGNYVYADGPLHVRVSLAIDAISMDLIAAGHDIMLAWLATPTDVFAAPIEAVEESRRRWRSAGLWRYGRSPLRMVGPVRPRTTRTPSSPRPGVEYGISDCLVGQQGPNYLLAKRLQRWRAMAIREDGVRVSLNVAPSTRTKSVVKNKALAAAYAGAGRFGLEIFEPDTSNAIMAALLVHDLRNPESTANPEVPIAHPMQLFVDGSCHGGLWRSEYSARSVLGFAAVAGMFERNA